MRVSQEIILAGQKKEAQKRATLDIDATIEESHKEEAKMTYEGERGYQPTMVVWAEKDLIVSDEFRDGNVPAQKDLVRVLEVAVSNLPKGVEEIYVRSDTAAYNHDVLGYCRTHGYKFAISADMTPKFLSEIQKLPDGAWVHWKDENDAVKQWAEVPYVPSWPYESKDAKPDRYLAIRILKNQGSLFADGTDRRHFGVVTSRSEEEIGGQALLEWQREKSGTVELAALPPRDEERTGGGCSAVRPVWGERRMVSAECDHVQSTIADAPPCFSGAAPERPPQTASLSDFFCRRRTGGSAVTHAR